MQGAQPSEEKILATELRALPTLRLHLTPLATITIYPNGGPNQTRDHTPIPMDDRRRPARSISRAYNNTSQADSISQVYNS